MAGATTTVDSAHEVMQDVGSHWGLVLGMGILSIIIGVLAITQTAATLVTIAIFFAAWLFVSGIVSLIQAFTRDATVGARVLSAIIGLLSIIVGFALLRSPFQSLEVLIFVLGVVWVSQGIVTFVRAFEVKEGRGWGIFMGVLGIVAGIIVLEYPAMSAATLALFGGIWLIILGGMQIYAAFKLRGLAKTA